MRNSSANRPASVFLTAKPTTTTISQINQISRISITTSLYFISQFFSSENVLSKIFEATGDWTIESRVIRR